MRESVEAMKAIWTQDEAEYHGGIIDFDPIWCWPKPVQKPHPPVLVGGLGEKVLDRVVAYGDEWIPNRVKSPEELRERIAELQRRAEAAGRERIPVTVFGAKPEVRLLERLRAAGVDACAPLPAPGEAGEVERQLDEFGRLAADGPARRARPEAVALEEEDDERLEAGRSACRAAAGAGREAARLRGGSGRRSRSCSRAGTRRARAAR